MTVKLDSKTEICGRLFYHNAQNNDGKGYHMCWDNLVELAENEGQNDWFVYMDEPAKGHISFRSGRLLGVWFDDENDRER